MIFVMGLMVQLIYLVLKALAILLVLQESAGSGNPIAPSPSLPQMVFSSISPTREGTLHPIPHWMQSRGNTPSSASQPYVQPLKFVPAQLFSKNVAGFVSPITPIYPPINSAAPSRNFHSHMPSSSPCTLVPDPGLLHPLTSEVPLTNLQVPGVSPTSTSPPSYIWRGDGTPVGTPLSVMPEQLSPLDSPTKGDVPVVAPVQLFHKGASNPPPGFLKIKFPPHAELQSPAPSPSIPIYRRYHPRNKITIPAPLLSPVYPPASTDKEPDFTSVSIHPQSFDPKREEMPVAALLKAIPELPLDHSSSEETGISPISSPSLGLDQKKDTTTVSVPSNGNSKQLLPQAHFPVKAPMQDSLKDFAKSPTMSPAHKWFQPSTPIPSTPYSKNGHAKENTSSSTLSSFAVPSNSTNKVIAEPPSHPPNLYPNTRHRSHTPQILHPVPPSNYPFTSMENPRSPVSPTRVSPSQQMTIPSFPPRNTPSEYSSPRNPMVPHLPHIQALPPSPLNEDCPSLSCRDPFTKNPPGSPCGCVLAMQVGLLLGLPLNAFFPLVKDLATEISRGVLVQQSQVRITGANADRENQEKTIVLFDLVPFGAKFDNFTAYLIYQRFLHKQMFIKPNYFGNYEVLYMRYPGLPASPPAPSTFDGQAFYAQGNKGRPLKPLVADVSRQQNKKGLKGSVIAIIVLLASVSVILCCAVAWVVLFRHRHSGSQPKQAPATILPSLAKSAGFGASKIGSGLSSISPSYNSGLTPRTGTAQTFNAIDIERATNSFDASRILGEGGFGIVYSGVLDDETKVAVKVLKRDNQQGGREFLAEIEMLSRLHHRNLVKLLGICMEEHARCLVYELIPNGSVESHLHGVDKEDAPLDWNARLKIALGAARGLAYLHEDSSPRVIHRDFKSSNILLQHDFTPKVSDFGLARTGSDEEGKHISTRVMGTFGYVAPEYAMTGHLLVKSDVYSYGVVLLELLTGRKPVDMSRPTGQENLVTWARPLLSSKEGLELVMDQSLRPESQFESIAKVAAIASMCVQPEVTDRPFMSEVVQALKLICNECCATNNLIYSPEDVSFNFEARSSTSSGHMPYYLRMQSPGSDVEWGLGASEVFSASERFGSMHLRSLRRQSSPGPSKSRKVMPLLQRMRGWSGGSKSEHGATFWLWSRSR